MQNEAAQCDVITAQENLNAVISRLERAINANIKKNANEHKIYHQVIKELDSHIANLETLLNPKKK